MITEDYDLDTVRYRDWFPIGDGNAMRIISLIPYFNSLPLFSDSVIVIGKALSSNFNNFKNPYLGDISNPSFANSTEITFNSSYYGFTSIDIIDIETRAIH